ncbi:MAG TPA: HEAT repeat domain-containing protein [Gemmataceae bacterium]|nr:HEAT repeat domain-containing protein [Gemmataceae bacterium]
MTKWTICGTGLALFASGALHAWAQPPIPAAPPVPGPPPLVAPAAPAAPAAPNNLWSFLMPNAQQKANLVKCKEKICAMPIGQMFNNSLAPIGAFSGGLLGPCCPTYRQDDLLKPTDSAEGAAAMIKKDEAEAKARVAAVRYLAHADCAYWPEAGDALVKALREDRNECVRFAAAQALGTGCCCGKKTIVALSISAAGSDRDNNPAEKSDRVRFAAQAALENCLARCGCAIPVPTEQQEKEREQRDRERGPESTVKPASATEAVPAQPVTSAVFYKRVAAMSNAQVIDTVRQSILTWTEASAQLQGGTDDGATGRQPSNAADHSLFGLVASAVEPVKASLAPPGRQTQPVAQVTKATAPPPATPYQATAIQPAGYQYPTPRAWPAADEAPAAKPVAVLPASNPTTNKSGPPSPPSQGTGTAKQFPPANGRNVNQVLAILRDGARPEQRAWAAAELAGVDGRGNPDVVDALVAVGQLDASGAVRAECVRSLVKMNPPSMAVRELFESLQNDADPAVQEEIRRVLGKSAN